MRIVKALVCMITAVLWIEVGLAKPRDCLIEARDSKSSEFNIFDGEKRYLGYIALEEDGSWFVWIDKRGAANDKFSSKENAMLFVCGFGAGSTE